MAREFYRVINPRGGRTLRPPFKETRDYDLPQDDRPRPGETAEPGSGGRPDSAGL